MFLIKYLRYLGYDVGNENFAKNAWCFRNALVRANYNDIQKQVDELKKVFDGNKTVFGRSDIVNALKLAPSSASELIKKLLVSNIIEPVKGHGKGKYRFADI